MPTATIFGASSNHGRSIVDALSADQWRVRAVVRSSYALSETDNVTVIHMPRHDQATIRQAVDGADLVYISHVFDFNDCQSYQNELAEGKMIGDACKDHATAHVIYNTQLSPKQVLGLTAQHCDVKAQVEEYLQKLKLPLTCLELPFLYESLYTVYQPEMVNRAAYRLAIPVGKLSLDCISYRDVGPVVARVAADGHSYLHKTLALAGDKISVKEMAETLGEMTGWDIKDRQITVYEFKELGWPGCADIGNYFDFICRVDQRFNVFATRKLHPRTLTFKEWTEAHKAEVMKNMFGYQLNGQ